MSSAVTQKQLTKYFFDQKNAPGALSGPSKLAEGVRRVGKQVSAKAQKQLYQDDAVLRQHYGVPKAKPEHVSKMTSNYSLEKIHVDIADFTNELRLPAQRYLLCCVDCFSRFAFCEIIKSRETSDLIKGFKGILSQMNKVRQFDFQAHSVIIGDREFNNKKLAAYLKTNGHTLKTISSSLSKSFLAENLIKIFRSKLFLIKQKLGFNAFDRTGGWGHFVNQIITGYNQTIQERIKFSPAEAILMPRKMLERRAKKLPALDYKAWRTKIRNDYRQNIKKYLHQYVRLVLIKAKEFAKQSQATKLGRELFLVVQVRKNREIASGLTAGFYVNSLLSTNNTTCFTFTGQALTDRHAPNADPSRYDKEADPRKIPDI